jgi:hypothetical protein
MARVETCEACGREISGDLIPKRVLGKVLCPDCDRRRVRDMNRHDRVPVLIFLAAAHGFFGLGLLSAGVFGVLRWWAARFASPDGATLMDLLLALVLLPLGALLSWTAWNLWRLEGRGRLVALFLDATLAILALYWLLDGNSLALFGVVPFFAFVYLFRSATADRFW